MAPCCLHTVGHYFGLSDEFGKFMYVTICDLQGHTAGHRSWCEMKGYVCFLSMNKCKYRPIWQHY